MVTRWAHVVDGVVVQVSLWDGNPDTWTPPDDCELVELTDDQNVGPGALYDGETFTLPEIVPDASPQPVAVSDPAAFQAALEKVRTATSTAARLNAVIAVLATLE